MEVPDNSQSRDDKSSSTKCSLLYKRKLERIDEGIFRYAQKDGETRYAVRFNHQQRDWRKFGFPNVTKARTWLNSRKGRIAENRLFPEQASENTISKTATPFVEYSRSWLEGCRVKNLKHSTLLRYQGLLRKHLVPALGGLSLQNIQRNEVRQLAAAMHTAGAAPKTIHNAVRVVSAIFEQGIEDQLVSHNPAQKPSKLVKITNDNEPPDVFSHDEEVLILQAAKKHIAHYYAFILLLFRTGLREGEAVALKPQDVDLRHRYLIVRRNFTAGRMAETPKNGKSRKVDLSQDLVQIMREHMAIRSAEAAMTNLKESPWLFTTSHGTMIRSNNFRDRIWRLMLKQLSLRYRCVHAARHTFATRMIMKGANLVYVQKQLGHSSIQITVDLYTHWIDEGNREAALEVDRLMDNCGHTTGHEVGTFVGTAPQSI